MKNNGFTLVELLAVVVILAIVMTIAGISVNNIRSSANEKLLKTTVDNVVASAIVWGQKNNSENLASGSDCSSYKDFLNSFYVCEATSDGNNSSDCESKRENHYKSYSYCTTVTIQELIDDGDFESEDTDESGNIVLTNPITNQNMLNDVVLVYRKNNRVYASMLKDSFASCYENGSCVCEDYC